MKRSLLALLLMVSVFTAMAGRSIPENIYAEHFENAYQACPTVPRGLLEAVAFTNTRFTHLTANEAESCTGMPRAHTVMGLIADGKGYFRNTLTMVAEAGGFTVQEIIDSPEKCILGYAKAYEHTASSVDEYLKRDDHRKILLCLLEMSELPTGNEVQNFAAESHIYSMLTFMNDPVYQSAFGFPNPNFDMQLIFAENYNIHSSSSVIINGDGVTNSLGDSYRTDPSLNVQTSDYGPALWNPAASCNYSSRNSTPISAVTIHTVQGTYAGCISWFQNCSASASAHYVIRSSDGQVTQMVSESLKAWHVGTENPYTIGLEHEGYVSNAAWYTLAMYTSSANLVRDICNSGYGIDPLRTYYGPGCSGSSTSCGIGACTKVKGHQMYPNQTHTDPGPNWNWALFYNLINNNPTINTLTTATGSFYDSGGQSGNYMDDERLLWLIDPPNATTVTLNFSSFDTELDWDYMFIYDGATTSAPLIGTYTGTSSPGTVSSSAGEILIEFRSDCATTSPGWACTWTSNGNPPPPVDNIAPTTQISAIPTWITADFPVTFTDADNTGGSGLEKSFYQVIDFDGTDWRANASRGFFSDNFDFALHPDWTISTGAWNTTGSTLNQTDETLSNTNIYAALTQNLSNRYLYHWSGKIDGTGTNRRAGFHFFSDDPTLPNRGNGYFVWFRIDQSELQFYKVTNDVFTLMSSNTVTFNAGQWYDYKVIYDRITGKTDVYVDNILVGTWTDPSPYSNGSHISFRSGNSTWHINNLKVYRSRASNVTVQVGPTGDIRYENSNPTTPAGRVKSMVKDTAGNLSGIAFTDINVDWTAPSTAATVNDGPGNDIDTTYNSTLLEVNWSASSDPNSDIAKYLYAIGTTPGDSDVVAWTDNWFYTSDSIPSLSLAYGQIYYTTVQVENGAGLRSTYTYSDGVLLPVITGISENENEIGLGLYPNPATENSTLYYTIAAASKVEIKLIDMLGREIQVFKGNEQAGKHAVELNRNKLQLSGGIYLVKVSVNEKEYSVKLVNK